MKSRIRLPLLVCTLILAVASGVYLSLDERERGATIAPQSVLETTATGGGHADKLAKDLPLILDSNTSSEPNEFHIGVVQVSFPNGSEVDVNLIQFVPPTPTVPVQGPLGENFDTLVTAAENGDGASARWLYRGLRACVGSFKDLERLDLSIATLHRTGHLTYPDGRVKEVGLGQQAVWMEEVVRDQFQTCLGLSKDQIDGRNRWLELASNSGDFLAMRDYAISMGTSTPEGFELYKRTWDDGHLGSASAMAIFYRNGAPAELGGQSDMLTSYAFTLLSNSTYKAIGRLGGDPSGPSRPLSANRLFAMDQLLSQKGGYLTPAEVEEAERLAVSLLSENRSCCLGNWMNQ